MTVGLDPELVRDVKLVNPLMVGEEDRQNYLAKAARLRRIHLPRNLVLDLELLATGAYSPLDRFMGEADYLRVLREMRLADGSFFPVPVVFPIPDSLHIDVGEAVALCGGEGEILATMDVEEKFLRDPAEETTRLYAAFPGYHPSLAELECSGRWCISGPLRILHLPWSHDFGGARRAPVEVRTALSRLGRSAVIAFQAHGPLTLGDEENTKGMLQALDGTLLLQVPVGLMPVGSPEVHLQLRSHETLIDRYYPRDRVLLNVIPLYERVAGAREVLLQALVHRNYGATHFMVTESNLRATVRGDVSRVRQEILGISAECAKEAGIEIVLPASRGSSRALPQGGGSETMRPEVRAIVAEAQLPKHRQGFCVWLTGLSGAGKSTIAKVLATLLAERGRRVTVLDGDAFRRCLSRDLSYDRQGRNENVLRMASVAAEIVRHGGAVICAAISPYRAGRALARATVGEDRFILCYVRAPLEVCERRDRKGLYLRARTGELKQVTGIDDPYEEPTAPDLVLDTVALEPRESARRILQHLTEKGFMHQDEV